MNVGSLFSGIGGLDLGLERAGMHVRWQCEIDPFCRNVLRRHWPDLRCYRDTREIDGSVEPVDVVCGGFPCQPVSFAGRGLAQDDPRWIWPEFARIVGLLRPRFVIVENVPGLVRRGLDLVVGSLAALGYDAEWEVVSAAACGAPHLRERIFIVGYPDDPGRKVFRFDAFRSGRPDGEDWAVEPVLGRMAYGIPGRLDQLRALGNAVVPQVAEAVGRMLLASVE